MRPTLLYIINVDWYFCLHWLARAEAAQAAGYEIHIATQITDQKLFAKLEKCGFVVHPLTLSRKSMGIMDNIRSFRQIANLIDSLKPALVHSITVKPNLFAGLISKWRKQAQIMSITGLGLTFSSNTLKARLSRVIVTTLYRLSCAKREQLKVLFENADDMLLFSKYKIANSNQLKVIAGAGVDLDEYPYLPHPTSATTAPVQILFAARMLWDKGLPVLIDAVKVLRQKGHGVEITVAGILDNDSQNAIPLWQIEQWNEQGAIKWMGQLSDMVSAIEAADIVCLPTQYGEGVPRILIEAAAVGRPIVTTDVSGCRDIVDDKKTGFLVPVNDSQTLAKQLEVLIADDNLRNEFGQKARQRVEDIFCQKKVIASTLAAYQETLS